MRRSSKNFLLLLISQVMPATVIGSQRCDLFTNHTISALNRICSKWRHFCFKSGQCKTQTADCCFQHENVTTIVLLFPIPKNNSPRSVRNSVRSLILHCQGFKSQHFRFILQHLFRVQDETLKPF